MKLDLETTHLKKSSASAIISIKKCKESNDSCVYSILYTDGNIDYLKLEERAYYDSEDIEYFNCPKNFSGITLKCTPEHQYLSFLMLDTLLNHFNDTFTLPLRLVPAHLLYLPFEIFKDELLKHGAILPGQQHEAYVLLSKKINAIPVTKAHLEQYSEIFTAWASFLHCLGVDDIKPSEHFLINVEEGTVYLLDYGLSTSSPLKIRKILNSIKENKNFIDYPEFDESPEDAKEAFIHLKTTTLHETSLKFIFLRMLDKFFYASIHHQNHFIEPSQVTKFLNDTLNHVIHLTVKLSKISFLNQEDLICLFPNKIDAYFLPFLKPVFYKKQDYVFWRENLRHALDVSLFSRPAHSSELHVYTSYSLKTLGDAQGALKIALYAQKIRLDVKVTLFIAIDGNASDREYLIRFLNSKPFNKDIQIWVFSATNSENCKLSLNHSKNKHIIFFEHDPYKLIEKLALKAKSFCYVPAYNKKPTSRLPLPAILSLKKQIQTGINSSGGVFPLEPFSEEAFKRLELKLPSEGLLFGGYLNKNLRLVLKEQKNAMPQYLKNYLFSCLALAQKHYDQTQHLNEKKTVSLIMNLDVLKISEKEIGLKQKTADTPIQLSLSEEELIHFGISKLTIGTENFQDNYDLNNPVENGLHLQILNFFPLNPDELQAFLKRLSHQPYPYFLVTMGTFTVLETIFHEKIAIFPQIMEWETGLWNAYKEKFQEYAILKQYFDLFDGQPIENLFENAQWIADMLFNVNNRLIFERVHQTIIQNTPSLLETIKAYLEDLIPLENLEENLSTARKLML